MYRRLFVQPEQFCPSVTLQAFQAAVWSRHSIALLRWQQVSGKWCCGATVRDLSVGTDAQKSPRSDRHPLYGHPLLPPPEKLWLIHPKLNNYASTRGWAWAHFTDCFSDIQQTKRVYEQCGVLLLATRIRLLQAALTGPKDLVGHVWMGDAKNRHFVQDLYHNKQIFCTYSFVLISVSLWP